VVEEENDEVTVKHFITGTMKVQAQSFYCGPSSTSFLGVKGILEDDVINWSNGATWVKSISVQELPDECTAMNRHFPEWGTDGLGEQDNWSICFNIKWGDMQLSETTDASFFWQGTYFKLNSEGIPKSDKWSSKLGEIADQNGIKQVEAYVQKTFSKGKKSTGLLVTWKSQKVG